MELVDFMQIALDRTKQATKRTVDGLTSHELLWRPGAQANSIGLILFHGARSEDTFIQATIQKKPQVWETEKWYEKLGMPLAETGSGYTAEQLVDFRPPELKDLLDYGDAVRAKTQEYLKAMTPEKFDEKVSWGRMGELSIGALVALVITHAAQHAGEIGYLRGLQRGMNK